MSQTDYFRISVLVLAPELVKHGNEIAIIGELKELNEDADFAFDEEGDANTDASWSGMENDMKEFSKRYPEAIFHINDKSFSSAEDYEIDYYFKDGRMQTCYGEMKMPPINIPFLLGETDTEEMPSKKKQVIDLLRDLIEDHDTDIVTGLEEGIYEKAENEGHDLKISTWRKMIDKFEAEV